MLNIACLYPQYFTAILAGAKQTERRTRKRIDARLEAIRPGEHVLLLECRSTRGLRCIVRAVKRFGSQGNYRYCIRLHSPQLINAVQQPHLQGWHRKPYNRVHA